MYNLEPIFPTYLHNVQVNITQEDVDYCYQLREEDPEGTIKSNVGGWQSEDFTSNNKLIESVINQTLEVFTKAPTLNNWWVNINKPNSYNGMHIHPGADMSGVIWIKIPEDSGNLLFPNYNYFCRTREIENYREEIIRDGSEYVVVPQSGNAILFPSFLQHEVTRNDSNEDRISKSFNLQFID